MLNDTYLLWMAGSALAAAAMHFATAGKLKMRAPLALLTLLFGALLGVVLARLGYCLLQMDYVAGYGFREVLFSDDLSMMNFFCGAAGVMLAALLAAKLTGNAAMPALNAFAPAGALMAALARFGEAFLGQICAGNYVENEALCFFPLAVRNEWDEWYIAVHLFTGLAYLVIALFSLLRFREKRFLRTVFYLCLVQVFFESLRNQSLIWSQFIRVEQLLCMVVVEAILIWLCSGAEGGGKRFLPAIVGLLCAGLFVAVEFAVGGKLFVGTSPVVFYLVMAVGLMALAALECGLIRHQRK